MKKILTLFSTIILLSISSNVAFAQQHFANGDSVIEGNRLTSAKSKNGKRLYQRNRSFSRKAINIDGRMDESDWKQANVITPFIGKDNRDIDTSSAHVLYDQNNIYLFFSVQQSDGITANLKKKDGVITSDDYIQIDLKPWLPDSISYGRDYHYSIAVNPQGVLWDAYYDPYLGGFYYSSWNSEAGISTNTGTEQWDLEMKIPYAAIDVSSDAGRKWELEFHHSSFYEGDARISSANIGVTVQQDTTVRQAPLVSYYWPRPDFMEEVKPDLSRQEEKIVDVSHLDSVPKIDGNKDGKIWDGAQTMVINHTDKMGKEITSDNAHAKVGLAGKKLSFNLQAEGAKIKKRSKTSDDLGEGMAAQMAGVNGVFVDQTLFQNESFWIILQPREDDKDNIHHDYYLINIRNDGTISGTHYDTYGAPFRSWKPDADVDLYNTNSGWGAEVVFDLSSFTIPFDYSKSWGINIFRNRLIEGEGSELQAWKYTGSDFLNPDKFGNLLNVNVNNFSVFRGEIEREIAQMKSRLLKYKDQDGINDIKRELKSLETNSQDQVKRARLKLQEMDHDLGVLDAAIQYQRAPHPAYKSKFPLMDIQMMDNYGWAVGAMGTILRTENGGDEWKKVSLDSNADLYRVQFINNKEGWAVGGRIRIAKTNKAMRHDERGGYAYIYHTTDSGKTWNLQFAERGRLLFALDFIDENVGYASGERGILMKTTDGGKHWKMLSTTGTRKWFYGMAFKDRKKGYLVGQNSTVLKTTDGGESWDNVDAAADRKFYGFRPIYRDIDFKGKTGCIVGTNGTVLISHDAGDTWKPTATFYQNTTRELMDLRRIQFVTPQQGYAVGELGTKIMTTADGGQNWSYRDTGDSNWLRGLWAEKSGNLTLIGEREKIMESPDKGLTWKTVSGEKNTKTDIMLMMAHGDDSAINFNSFLAYYGINKGKKIVDVGVMSDIHSSEYEEAYNLEHDRNIWMVSGGISTNFNEFETGNNGANFYHYNQRLWQGEKNIVRHMVAAIRAYKPDIVITHGGVFGDYDKPGHKVSGRAGLRAFESAGGEVDRWPELTRLGLERWQPKKLYNLVSQSYPPTIDITWIKNKPLNGTNITTQEYGNYVIRNFQSQGIYHHTGNTKLNLVKSHVPVSPEDEESVFDGLVQ